MQLISVINVPFQCGCDREGGALAPKWLFYNGTEEFTDIVKWLSVPTQQEECANTNGVRNHDKVVNICKELRDYVVEYRTQGKRVLTIGGDHAIALGSIAGVLTVNPKVGVIWFDAHGDVNTEATSPSANAHGMPLAALFGLCKSGLDSVASVYLIPQNTFWIGARDLDPGEIEIIKQLGIADNVYSTERIHRMGMTAVMDDINKKMKLQNVTATHLSFDIDGMDPNIVCATGTKVDNGLLQRELDEFIECMRNLPRMESMDFVEYNPLLDDENYTTGTWSIDILRRLINH